MVDASLNSLNHFVDLQNDLKKICQHVAKNMPSKLYNYLELKTKNIVSQDKRIFALRHYQQIRYRTMLECLRPHISQHYITYLKIPSTAPYKLQPHTNTLSMPTAISF